MGRSSDKYLNGWITPNGHTSYKRRGRPPGGCAAEYVNGDKKRILRVRVSQKLYNKIVVALDKLPMYMSRSSFVNHLIEEFLVMGTRSLCV